MKGKEGECKIVGRKVGNSCREDGKAWEGKKGGMRRRRQEAILSFVCDWKTPKMERKDRVGSRGRET